MRIGLSIGVEGSSRRRSRGERRGNSNNLPGGEKDRIHTRAMTPPQVQVVSACLPVNFFFVFNFCVCVCVSSCCVAVVAIRVRVRTFGHWGGGGGFAHPIISRGRRKNPRGNTSRRALIFISSPVSAAFSRSYSASVLVISTRVRETRAGAS